MSDTSNQSKIWNAQKEFASLMRDLHARKHQRSMAQANTRIRELEKKHREFEYRVVKALKDKKVKTPEISAITGLSRCQLERVIHGWDWRNRVKPNQPVQNANDLEIAVRTANGLSNAGKFEIKDILALTDHDLLKYRNFGVRSLADLDCALAAAGLKRNGIRD